MNSTVREAATSKAESLDAACAHACETGSCSHADPSKVARLADLAAGPQAPYQSSLLDLEDLARLGAASSSCSFFASRRLADSCSVLMCPYSYLLHPGTREQSELGKLMRSREVVIVLDEAHNIEEAACEASSARASRRDVSAAMGMLAASAASVSPAAAKSNGLPVKSSDAAYSALQGLR